MPNWNEVIHEIRSLQKTNPELNPLDTVRRKYLALVSKLSGRNTIDNQDFQDAVLTTHHAFMYTFNSTYAVKIIENHIGIAYIEQTAPAKK